MCMVNVMLRWCLFWTFGWGCCLFLLFIDNRQSLLNICHLLPQLLETHRDIRLQINRAARNRQRQHKLIIKLKLDVVQRKFLLRFERRLRVNAGRTFREPRDTFAKVNFVHREREVRRTVRLGVTLLAVQVKVEHAICGYAGAGRRSRNVERHSFSAG